MQIAIMNHAVERYRQRVPNAAKLSDEAIRKVIGELVDEAEASGSIQEHPRAPGRKMVEFLIGQERLYLALGPNDSDRETFPGEWAVIGVLFARDVGQKGSGATIGDLISMKRTTA
jgi:hypothetical protein